MFLNEKRQAWLDGDLSDGEWMLALHAAMAEVILAVHKRESEAGEGMIARIFDKED